MRDIMKRLNEAAGANDAESITNTMMTEIDAFAEKMIDQIEAVIKQQAAALSLKLPGHYVCPNGGHGMTSMWVLPPREVVDKLLLDEDQEEGGPIHTYEKMVDELNDYRSPNYFVGFKVADAIGQAHPSLSFTEFGGYAFLNGHEVPWKDAMAYQGALPRSIENASRGRP